MSTTVVQAYRFALDPNPEQEAALPSHCGGQRFAFNWGLARVKANLGQRKAEQSCGLAAGELTPSLNWSAYSLRKGWNRAKGVVAPWWGENSKDAYSSGLANLATALTNWSDSTKGKRQVRKLGFPQFKGKRGDSRAGSPPARAVWSGSDRRHMKLPRIAVGVRGGTGGGGEDRTRDKQG